MKTVIQMAREAGFHVGDQFVAGASEAELERLVDLARAEEREKWMDRTAILIRGEREACAKVADDWGKNNMTAVMIGEAIRARKHHE